MFFNREEMHYIWTKMLEWDDVSETQFCHTLVSRKNSVEIYVFYIDAEGKRMRLDYEINLEHYPAVGQHWPDEALDKMLEDMKELIDNG